MVDIWFIYLVGKDYPHILWKIIQMFQTTNQSKMLRFDRQRLKWFVLKVAEGNVCRSLLLEKGKSNPRISMGISWYTSATQYDTRIWPKIVGTPTKTWQFGWGKHDTPSNGKGFLMFRPKLMGLSWFSWLADLLDWWWIYMDIPYPVWWGHKVHQQT